MFNKPGMRSRGMKAVLVLLLLSLTTTTVSNGGVFRPAHATTLTGLGIWSATYRSPAILNASLVMNSFIVLRLNVTGGASINGFDANVTWNPTVLIYKNDTLKGGIFDPANVSFVPLA